MPSTSSTKKTVTKTTAAKKTPSTAKKTTKAPTKSAVKKSTASPAKKTAATTAKKTTKTPTKTTTKKSTTPTTKKATTIKSTSSTAKKSVKDTTPEFKTRVAKAYYKDDHKFELFCAWYLSQHKDKYGEPKLNPKKSRDGGVDIKSIKYDMFSNEDTIYYVSVKNKKSNIGTPDLDSIYGAMGKFTRNCDPLFGPKCIAVVMTSGEFSADAKAQAKKMGMILIDGHKLDKEKRID